MVVCETKFRKPPLLLGNSGLDWFMVYRALFAVIHLIFHIEAFSFLFRIIVVKFDIHIRFMVKLDVGLHVDFLDDPGFLL